MDIPNQEHKCFDFSMLMWLIWYPFMFLFVIVRSFFNLNTGIVNCPDELGVRLLRCVKELVTVMCAAMQIYQNENGQGSL